jgi:hypothetical protein
MKKTTRKLVLRKQIIRELSAKALTHVIGGLDTDDAYPQSNPKQCTSGFIVALDAYPQTGPKQCLAVDAYPQSRPKQCLDG